MEKLELKISLTRQARKKARSAAKNPLGQIDPMEPKPSDSALVQSDSIDKANLNQSNGSDCTNQSGQIDPIRLGQSDLMITENTTENTTEITAKITTEREALPEIAPSNLFAVDAEIRPKFTMSETWQPSEQFAATCRFRRINISTLSTDDQEDLINEFRSYWMTQNSRLSQSEWEHKLVGSLNRSLQRKQNSTAINSPQTKRAAISAAIMNIEDTSW